MRSFMRVGMLMAFVVAGVTFASAAGGPTEVTVPFDFVVQGHTLQAGTYTIRHTDFYDPSVLRFYGDNGKVMSVMAGPLQAQKKGSKLVFEEAGQDRVLKSLVTPDGTFSFRSVVAKHEKRDRTIATPAGN